MKTIVQDDVLRELLEQVQGGQIDVQEALEKLNHSGVEANDFVSTQSAITNDVHVDLDRKQRCGFSEVVFCEGKTVESILEVFQALHEAGQDSLGTRVSSEQAESILCQFPDAHHNPIGRTICFLRKDGPAEVGRVVVITAGTSDRPVAEEAVETLRWMRCGSELVCDVGVAGPHRLMERREKFTNADVVVVIAGMEGALPSVVGGFVDCPVIAVPTSVGYGASFGGVVALLGMLNSCASNVSVVNIDAGFKGGYVAGLIACRVASSHSKQC